MALYIINATKQNFRFQWRMLGAQKVVHFEVASGRQIRVDEGLDSEQLADLVHHMDRYGFRKSEEVGRLKDFEGMMYGLKPSKEDDILLAHDALVEKQEKRSAAEAVRGALALERTARDKKNPRTRLAKEVEVSVIQHVDQRNKTGDEINMTMTVANDGSSNVKLPQ